ncbi:prepilin-type N-terminal cleavage/methylation domain-containing protein [Candidatus Woesebacteria bacterium]|nr:prepilin-type N-terminal cleavage/methylation domain-containing protein [Candidatus Woesebacteria bacterium]
MVQSRKKGFTLIELIIGITILALLAVGLLAALDPAEQFAKARDTSTRNTLLEIYGALQRYEAAQENYPTAVSELVAGTGTYASNGTAVGSGASNMAQAVTDLIASGELKQNFKSAAGTALDRIYIYKDATYQKLMVCYKPTARSFKIAAGLFQNAANASVLGVTAPNVTAANETCAANAANPVIAAGADPTQCDLASTIPGDRECCVYCAQ